MRFEQRTCKVSCHNSIVLCVCQYRIYLQIILYHVSICYRVYNLCSYLGSSSHLMGARLAPVAQADIQVPCQPDPEPSPSSQVDCPVDLDPPSTEAPLASRFPAKPSSTGKRYYTFTTAAQLRRSFGQGAFVVCGWENTLTWLGGAWNSCGTSPRGFAL